MRTLEDVTNSLAYHKPPPGRTDSFQKLRDAATEFAAAISEHSPEGREKSIAYTKLEESAMWAIKALALKEE